MAVICPTILADNAHTFRSQLERVETFAKRIQIDLSDGVFSPTLTVQPANIYWPSELRADLHLMYKYPSQIIDDVIRLSPNLVILHAEADEDLSGSFTKLRGAGIKCGLAVLPATSIESVASQLIRLDHLLIFAGTLGSFGTQIDLTQLAKIRPAKDINPDLEIGWDGGINDTNVKALIDGGVDVLNVGGFIQRSDSPQEAYAILESLI